MARTLIVHYDSFLSGPLANRFVCSIIYFDFAIDTLVCHISALFGASQLEDRTDRMLFQSSLARISGWGICTATLWHNLYGDATVTVSHRALPLEDATVT